VSYYLDFLSFLTNLFEYTDFGDQQFKCNVIINVAQLTILRNIMK